VISVPLPRVFPLGSGPTWKLDSPFRLSHTCWTSSSLLLLATETLSATRKEE
jgi:hypothetical protein